MFSGCRMTGAIEEIKIAKPITIYLALKKLICGEINLTAIRSTAIKSNGTRS